jgi:hypothetical protein
MCYESRPSRSRCNATQELEVPLMISLTDMCRMVKCITPPAVQVRSCLFSHQLLPFCLFLYPSVCMYTHSNTYTRRHTQHAHTHTGTYTRIHTYIRIYTHIRAHTHTHTHTHTHRHTHTHVRRSALLNAGYRISQTHTCAAGALPVHFI